MALAKKTMEGQLLRALSTILQKTTHDKQPTFREHTREDRRIDIPNRRTFRLLRSLPGTLLYRPTIHDWPIQASTTETCSLEMARDTKWTYPQPNDCIMSLNDGRLLGTPSQQALMILTKSPGESAGIFGRCSLMTTRTNVFRRHSSSHGSFLESTSQTTTPKLYTSLA